MDAPKRLVITGFGSLTPVAIGTGREVAAAILSGKVGNKTVVDDGTGDQAKSRHSKRFMIGTLDPERVDVERKRIEDLHAAARIKNRISKTEPKSARLMQVATDIALRDAGLLQTDQVKLAEQLNPTGTEGISKESTPDSVELYITANTEMQRLASILDYLRDKERLRPSDLVESCPNYLTGPISLDFGITGLTQVIQAACAGSISCIDSAIKSLRQSGTDSKVALIGSAETEAIGPVDLNAFAAPKIVKPLEEGVEDQYYRAFDKTHGHVRLSEGAGCLVLEELEHAKDRGANIYAEVIAAAQKSDADSRLAPTGEGLEKAIKLALKMANLKPEDMTFVQVHGSGNNQSDEAEARALRNVFGEHLPNLKVTANKARHGHTLHNAAFVNMLELALSLKEQKATPNLARDNPLDATADIPLVGTNAESCNGEYGMAFGLGVGGTNAVVIMKRYNEENS